MGYGLYFLFASCMVVFPVVIFLLYPETKGVPLEVIDHLFEVPAWKGRAFALEQFQIEFENGQFNNIESVESDTEEKLS